MWDTVSLIVILSISLTYFQYQSVLCVEYIVFERFLLEIHFLVFFYYHVLSNMQFLHSWPSRYGHYTDRCPTGLGQYNGLGEYCGPHTASSVFLILVLHVQPQWDQRQLDFPWRQEPMAYQQENHTPTTTLDLLCCYMYLVQTPSPCLVTSYNQRGMLRAVEGGRQVVSR